MLPGFGGHLVSEQFLEGAIPSSRGQENTGTRAALAALRARSQLGPASSCRSIFECGATPLLNAMGFSAFTDVSSNGGRLFATAAGDGHRVGLLVTPWGERLDPLWRPAIAAARERGLSWCLLFNAVQLRVVNADRVYSRRYCEFLVDLASTDPAAFAAMTAMAGPSADAILAGSERHAAAVCHTLRDGVLAASQHVVSALATRRASSIDAAFDQALTIVYRLLFLLFAEARALVPLWHPVYREAYSIERLRDGSIRGGPRGLWEALRAVARLAHAGCRAGDLRVTPFNGRLFAPSRTPLLERRDLDDCAARDALMALTTRRASDGESREVISYRDLGVEQLGAVYETLLDYQPIDASTSRHGLANVELRRTADTRKATGTFYTPQPLAAYLIRQTLAPLVRDVPPERILDLRVVDPSMGSGAFLVGACAYLADAYEAALLDAGGCHPTDFGPAERAAIRRTIAERCLYGVDLNPMAVQLARLSLWLTSLAADRPLSFLDHHLATGDSLLGAWVSCLRQPPVDRRQTPSASLPLFDAAGIETTVRAALPIRFDLAGPSDTPDHVRAKERALAALIARDGPLSKWKQIADVWCARWFGGSAAEYRELAAAILDGSSALPSSVVDRRLADVASTAERLRFFHWELEFPEVFFDRDGRRMPDAGFDAVLGNPPWDMIRGDSGPSESRGRARDLASSVVRFTRDSGVYAAQSDGHANRYQLFLERAMALARPGGRIGMVLPAGVASDHGSARLRRLLFDRCAVDTVVGFENRRAIFPIHRSVRFVLMTATSGPPTEAIRCRFGETDPSALDSLHHDDARPGFLTLTRHTITAISGAGAALPDVRSAIDLRIAERAARLFPPVGSAVGWGARFGRELNATDDRRLFRAGGGYPIVEGKQLEPFAVNLTLSRMSLSRRDASRLLGARADHARLAYRDVASATNQQTLIAAMLPARCVTTHTLFCLRTPLRPRTQYFLCGLFNSFVVNYLVRMRVNTHVTAAIVEQLPVPRADQAGPAFDEIAALARLLCRHRDATVLARLNGRAAHLYELTDEEFEHVLDTFPLAPRSDRDGAMREFRR